MTKSTKTTVATFTAAEVLEFWGAARGGQIVSMMKGGLPYWRAVRRSRRYFFEGKYTA